MSQPAPGVTPDLFWQTMTAFQASAVLKAAVDLEIFTKIGEGNTTAAEIARAAGAAERGVRILCDSLTTIGFLTKSGDGYALTESTAAFLDKRSPA
ncbi:MAG TPA: methyltransferase dimerization domain-containing protein, partial [Pyrinomonadaceae bacterium]|nr:methyltransferase dimerization domain-containing protein [Pyrinomonadaceae bacterium]